MYPDEDNRWKTKSEIAVIDRDRKSLELLTEIRDVLKTINNREQRDRKERRKRQNNFQNELRIKADEWVKEMSKKADELIKPRQSTQYDMGTPVPIQPVPVGKPYWIKPDPTQPYRPEHLDEGFKAFKARRQAQGPDSPFPPILDNPPNKKYKHKYVHKMFDGTKRVFMSKEESEKFYNENKADTQSIDVIGYE